MLILNKTENSTIVINLDKVECFYAENDMENYSFVFELPGVNQQIRFFYDSKAVADSVMSAILDAYKNGEKVVDISQVNID